MDVGIIAASLIVMRPFLKAIHDFALKRCHFRRGFFARTSPHDAPSRAARLLRDTGIVRTVDVELESRAISTNEVSPKDMLP